MRENHESKPEAESAQAIDAPAERSARLRVMWLSFTGFTLLFGAWTMFGVLGVLIRDEMRLSSTDFAWLVALAILNGSLWRMWFGMLADRYGGRLVFFWILVATAVGAFLVSQAQTFTQLLVFGFIVGIAGNAFGVGTAWNAAWFPRHQQGFAMGLFGAGNVGASITKFVGPALIALVPMPLLGGLVPGGWRFVPFLYCILLLSMAAILWIFTPKPDRKPGIGRSLADMHKPLKDIRVWRFSLYYVVVFGAYVAMAVWLPRYYVDVYGLPLATAALITTPFILASSLLRPFGGYLSDRFGARPVTYAVFIVTTVAAVALSFPIASVALFTTIVLLIGIAQGIGKASTIKYAPEYYPKDVGAVVGLMGALGGIGGFFMPLLFAYLESWTGRPQTMFWVLLALTAVSLLWLHAVVLSIHRDERRLSQTM